MKKLMQRPSLAAPFAVLALAALIAGCSTNKATIATAPTPIPTPTAACTTPPGESIILAFPQVGPTSVPNGNGVVIAAAPNPLPTNWYTYVSSSFGNASGGFLQSIAPSAVPTPSTTPPFANPNYQLSAYGIFTPGTTFTVFLANTVCYPGLNLGGFTT